jgi:hypothetical protein
MAQLMCDSNSDQHELKNEKINKTATDGGVRLSQKYDDAHCACDHPKIKAEPMEALAIPHVTRRTKILPSPKWQRFLGENFPGKRLDAAFIAFVSQ